MRSTVFFRAAPLVLAGFFTLGLAGTPSADDQPATAQEITQAQEIFQRAAQGESLTADEQVFLAANPEVAAGLVDLSQESVEEGYAEELPAPTPTCDTFPRCASGGNEQTMASTKCYNKTASVPGGLSVWGPGTTFARYTYKVEIQWCASGGKMKSVTRADAYVNFNSSAWRYATAPSLKLAKTQTYGWNYTSSAALEYCVLKYGCIGTVHPNVRVAFYADGKFLVYHN
jgi:hypothetical protein